MKLGKHHYRPDFPLLERNTIIEAMGLNSDSYWRRNRKKTKDYLHNKYDTITVVPNEQLYQKAIEYLDRKVKIVKYDEFENFVTSSLRKVPDKECFSEQKSRRIQASL